MVLYIKRVPAPASFQDEEELVLSTGRTMVTILDDRSWYAILQYTASPFRGVRDNVEAVLEDHFEVATWDNRKQVWLTHYKSYWYLKGYVAV